MARIQKVQVIIRGINDELVEEIVQIPEYVTPGDWLSELLEGYSAYVILNHTSYRKAEIVKVIPIYDPPETQGAYESESRPSSWFFRGYLWSSRRSNAD